MRVCPVVAATLLYLVSVPATGFPAEFTTEMKQFMQLLETQAKKQEGGFTGFDAERGKKIFFEEHQNEKTGKISCVTCHTSDLKRNGKTLVGKPIDPLAPSANRKRLTDVKEVEKWLLRNFKQVYGREGTAREKGDVLVFINRQ
jgi:cytochrome c peroxidase